MMVKLLARFGGRVSLDVISRLSGPGVGETRLGALARRMLGPLRYSNVVIPFGRCSGLPFNAGGSAPSFALGISEPDVQVMLANLLAPGMVFYDIGANVGFYTVLGVRCVGPTGHVYAFEPLPENVSALRRNLELQCLEAATVLPYAVTDRTGMLDFTVAEEPFWGRLATLPAPRGAIATIRVSATSIDELLVQGLVTEPDVVKIDVEGAELDVLRGMMRTLRLSHPAIVCEMHGKWAPIVELLESERYRVQPLDVGGGNRSERSRHLVATYRG